MSGRGRRLSRIPRRLEPLVGTGRGRGRVRLADGRSSARPVERSGAGLDRHPPGEDPLGGGAENTLEGTVKEQAYIGVSTQYVVETYAGTITVYVQNTDPGAQLARPGDRVTLSWSPEATFVVSVVGEKEEKTE